jgi:hypothetical protein
MVQGLDAACPHTYIQYAAVLLRQNNSEHFRYLHLGSNYSTSNPLQHMSAIPIPVYENMCRKVMLTSALHLVQKLCGNADGGAT